MFPALAFLALCIEAACGYPDFLLKRIGHPVIWIGRLIAIADRRLNRNALPPERRRLAGIVALLVVVAAATLPMAAIQTVLGTWPLGILIAAMLATSLIAQRSLATHVRDVAGALESGGIEAGRTVVSRIVGRDTGEMDESDICRAAIESLAENYSDGVVAPAFWLALAGLPGIAFYKAVNTADSMIGHPNERYREFGWASARTDDWINLPASRLASLLVIAAAAILPGASAAAAWRVTHRDARHHRSPNAGWPESSFAGALGIALAGPRRYGGRLVDDGFIGAEGRHRLDRSDIHRALALFRVADALLIVAAGLAALAAFLIG